MGNRHTISHASELFFGNAQHNGAYDALRGVPFTPIYQADLGAPIAADADGLIKAATGAELPNATTIVYSFPHASASPQDGVNLTGVLDAPRNVTVTAAHATSIVAMTVLVRGLDLYDVPMSELFTVTATGTSLAVVGKKAFAKVLSASITAAGDATANTIDIGWGTVLGLPFRLGASRDIVATYRDLTMDIANATIVAGDATTATPSTGDVRGTHLPGTVPDGTRRFCVWMKINGTANRAAAYGVNQA